METPDRTVIIIEATIQSSIERVWKYWTDPAHIIHWNNASPDWHTPKADNDLKINGRFTYTMAARDGSMSFDFGGVYTNVEHLKTIAYALDDGRKVKTDFQSVGDGVNVVTSFDAETQNSVELQKSGWQAILNNFKKYVENN
jgi:uncharacterized protein YndB with AHSA1/START domain